MCEKLTVFFYPKNQKRMSITMTKPKTLEQLRTEKERAETQLAQEQHKLNRLENRKKYLEQSVQAATSTKAKKATQPSGAATPSEQRHA
jgi:predicted  nucleic acid-binding Zn-ribbon protein